MMWRPAAAALLLVAAAASAPAAHWWQAGPPLPRSAGRVTDEARLLPPAVASDIGRRFARLEAATGHQFMVLTVSSLQGQRIEDLGVRLGRSWGVGRKDINDGVLLVVAPKERRVRIEVGYGLEKSLSDPVCAKIIRETIRPRFRSGDMPGGISAGVNAIIARIGK